jgi:hypothetical protein
MAKAIIVDCHDVAAKWFPKKTKGRAECEENELF